MDDPTFITKLIEISAAGDIAAERAFIKDNGGKKRIYALALRGVTRAKRSAPAKSAPTRLSDDFPDQHAKDLAIAYWTKVGRPDLIIAIDLEISAFRERHGNDKQADWGAKWRTCYVNAPKFNRKPLEVRTGAANPVKFRDAHEWLGHLRHHAGLDDFPVGYWRPDLGPAPHEWTDATMTEAQKVARRTFEARNGKIRA